MIIYKYKLPFIINEIFQINLPEDAGILSFQFQNDNPFIWAIIDKQKAIISQEFLIMGTGHDFPEDFIGKFVGTWQDNPFVWHLFLKELPK